MSWTSRNHRDRGERPPWGREWKRVVLRAREAGAAPRRPPRATFGGYSALFSELARDDEAEWNFRRDLARFAVEIAGPPPRGWHVIVSADTGALDGYAVGLTRDSSRATISLDCGPEGA